jgi:pilus assembly protein CpaF
MVMMAGYELPLRAIREQISSALDLVIQIERMSDGSRRVIAITEVQGMESDVMTLQDLYTFKVESVADRRHTRHIVGSLVSSGLPPTFLDKFERRGVELPAALAGSRTSNSLRAVDARA